MKSGFFIRTLQRIREAAQKTFAFIFVKIRDPQTGRLPISNSSVRLMFITLMGVFFVFIVINNFMKNHRGSGSLDDYTKEIQNEKGMVARPIDKLELFEADPAKSLPYVTADSVGATSTASGNSVAPSRDECFSLIQRMKDGEPNFSLQEQKQVDLCLNENVAGLSNEELAMAKALNDKTLSPQQREALRAQWAGNPDKLSKDAALNALKPVMTTGGPEKVSEKAGIAADKAWEFAKAVQSSGDKAAQSAYKKLFTDTPLSEKDKKALSKYGAKEEDGGGSVLSFLGSKSGSSGDPSSTSGKEQALKEAAERVKARQAELEKVRAELADSQARARAAADKIAKGKVVSPEETENLKNLADLNQKRAELEAQIAKDAEELRNIMNDLKAALAEANSLTEELPSGTFEGHFEGSHGKRHKRGSGTAGTSTSAPEKKVISFKELESMRLKELQDSLLDGTKVAGKLLNESGFGKDDIDASKLGVSFNDKQVLRLRSSMKIAATLDSEIYIASNSQGQQVRVRTLMDVYDAETNKVALPKGTVLIGTASSFNEETGVMELTFTKGSVGKKIYEFTMRVGSADGSMGLRGDIYDTRGRKLLAALITSFSSGVLNWFSQNIVAQYQTSKQADLAITGAALGGAGEVGNKIASMYAADLNNAPSIFYAPKNTPLILFPDDQ